jgi:alpha-galactosidase
MMSAGAQATGAEANPPATVADALALVAPKSLQPRFEPGPGFDVHLDLNPVAVETLDNDSFQFTYDSTEGIRAVCTVRLDRQFRVAVYQVRLKNSAAQASRPLPDFQPLLLRLSGMANPRILSCRGASNQIGMSFTREVPPDAFRTQWISPLYPRRVTLTSGGSGERKTGASNANLPLFMLSAGADWNGPGMWFGFAWSTSWDAEIAFVQGKPDRLRLHMQTRVGELVLEPGESLELPAVHIGFFDKGFDSGTNACRRYIHTRLTPRYMGKPTVPPVAYTLWPGISVSYTDEELRPHVDAAAEMGIEMFCVDADWYVGGYQNGLGNWEVDSKKFPNGIEAFARYVQSKGMGMGLYFDAGVKRGSRVFREHPEFVYPVESREHHFKTNFGVPEAAEFMIETISRFTELCDLRYVRCDFFCDPPDFRWDRMPAKGKTAYAHLKGLYRVWDTLRERHPKLMLELNNGGGNAFDLGTISRNYCAWANDFSGDPHACRGMQLGGNTFLPGNYFGLAIGPVRDGPTRGLDAGFSDLSFLSRMAGELLLHGALANWPDEVKERARHWVAIYKQIRHLLVADYYRLLTQPQSDADWDAAQFCDGSGEGAVFVFRHHGYDDRQPLKLRALNTSRNYVVRDRGTGQQQTVSGQALTATGLEVELQPNSAKLFTYRRVD